MAEAPRLTLLAGVALLVACSEGYPPDEPPVNPAAVMTLGERLDRMNELGRSADPQARWHYTLPDPCELGVVAEVQGQDTLAVSLALDRPVSFEGIDEPDGGYGVSVETASGSTTALFGSPRWPDVVEMRFHLNTLRQACLPPVAPAASAGSS